MVSLANTLRVHDTSTYLSGHSCRVRNNDGVGRVADLMFRGQQAAFLHANDTTPILLREGVQHVATCAAVAAVGGVPLCCTVGTAVAFKGTCYYCVGGAGPFVYRRPCTKLADSLAPLPITMGYDGWEKHAVIPMPHRLHGSITLVFVANHVAFFRWETG